MPKRQDRDGEGRDFSANETERGDKGKIWATNHVWRGRGQDYCAESRTLSDPETQPRDKTAFLSLTTHTTRSS